MMKIKTRTFRSKARTLAAEEKAEAELKKFKKRLRSMCGRKIGSGVYGAVYAHAKNPKLVVKICETTEDGYLDWVSECADNSKNPYFPKIKRVVRVEDSVTFEGDFCFAIMERLIPFHKVPARFRKKSLRSLGVKMTEDLNYGQFVPDCQNKNTLGLKKALNRIDANDCHEGNVMFRRRGRGYQLVVTDPVAR